MQLPYPGFLRSVGAVGAKPGSDTAATHRALLTITERWPTTTLIRLNYDLAPGEVASTYQKLTAQQTSLSYHDHLIEGRPDVHVHDMASSSAVAVSVGVCLMTTMSPRHRVLVT